MFEVHQLPVGYVLPLIWDSLDTLALILLPVVAMQYQTLFWSETAVVEFTLLSSAPLSTSHKFKPNCKNTCGQENFLLMQSETAINQCCCTTSASLIHYLHNYKQQIFRLSQSCCHSPLLGMLQWHCLCAGAKHSTVCLIDACCVVLWTLYHSPVQLLVQLPGRNEMMGRQGSVGIDGWGQVEDTPVWLLKAAF